MFRQDGYGANEVGTTHPDFPSNITLNDGGDIDITAKPGVGLVLSRSSRSVVVTARKVRFITKKDSLFWNNKRFNEAAVQYSQPTLVDVERTNMRSGAGDLFDGV